MITQFTLKIASIVVMLSLACPVSALNPEIHKNRERDVQRDIELMEAETDARNELEVSRRYYLSGIVRVNREREYLQLNDNVAPSQRPTSSENNIWIGQINRARNSFELSHARLLDVQNTIRQRFQEIGLPTYFQAIEPLPNQDEVVNRLQAIHQAQRERPSIIQRPSQRRRLN
jgi:hypothetical protein